jgi:hypothetical protein
MVLEAKGQGYQRRRYVKGCDARLGNVVLVDRATDAKEHELATACQQKHVERSRYEKSSSAA